MNTSWPSSPEPNRVGAKPLNIAIAAASAARVRGRPKRSAIQPEATTAPAARKAPTICTTRNWLTDWSEYNRIHDSGKIVTMWNSA